MELYWFPMGYCIQFKLALLMHMVHTGQSPFITDEMTPVNHDSSRPRLYESECVSRSDAMTVLDRTLNKKGVPLPPTSHRAVMHSVLRALLLTIRADYAVHSHLRTCRSDITANISTIAEN